MSSSHSCWVFFVLESGILAAREPELSLLSPMVSIRSTYTQPCNRKGCKVVPKSRVLQEEKKKQKWQGKDRHSDACNICLVQTLMRVHVLENHQLALLCVVPKEKTAAVCRVSGVRRKIVQGLLESLFFVGFLLRMWVCMRW